MKYMKQKSNDVSQVVCLENNFSNLSLSKKRVTTALNKGREKTKVK
jgi:hypothetical protein